MWGSQQRPQSQAVEPYMTYKQEAWQEPSEAPTNGPRTGDMDAAQARGKLKSWYGAEVRI